MNDIVPRPPVNKAEVLGGRQERYAEIVFDVSTDGGDQTVCIELTIPAENRMVYQAYLNVMDARALANKIEDIAALAVSEHLEQLEESEIPH